MDESAKATEDLLAGQELGGQLTPAQRDDPLMMTIIVSPRHRRLKSTCVAREGLVQEGDWVPAVDIEYGQGQLTGIHVNEREALTLCISAGY